MKVWADGWAEGWVDGRCVRHGGWPVCEVWVDRWAEGEGKGGVWV